MEYPLGHLCHLPTSSAAPAHLLVEWEAEKALAPVNGAQY